MRGCAGFSACLSFANGLIYMFAMPLTIFFSWIQLIQDASVLPVSVLPTVRVPDELLTRTGYRGQEIGNAGKRRNMLEQNFGMRLYDGALLA